jgi:hypothetical protein
MIAVWFSCGAANLFRHVEVEELKIKVVEQAAEITQLKEELEKANTILQAEKYTRVHVKAINLASLEREIERLRAALKET